MKRSPFELFRTWLSGRDRRPQNDLAESETKTDGLHEIHAAFVEHLGRLEELPPVGLDEIAARLRSDLGDVLGLLGRIDESTLSAQAIEDLWAAEARMARAVDRLATAAYAIARRGRVARATSLGDHARMAVAALPEPERRRVLLQIDREGHVRAEAEVLRIIVEGALGHVLGRSDDGVVALRVADGGEGILMARVVVDAGRSSEAARRTSSQTTVEVAVVERLAHALGGAAWREGAGGGFCVALPEYLPEEGSGVRRVRVSRSDVERAAELGEAASEAAEVDDAPRALGPVG